MPAKFRVGDYARVGGPGHRPLVAAYPWLKRGQVLRVRAIKGKINGHIEYQFNSRRGMPGVFLAAYDLRRVEDRERAPGAGPKRKGAAE